MQCSNTYWASSVHPPGRFFTQSSHHNEDTSCPVVTLPLPSHVKSITSPSNPFVKHCFKLRHSSSYRYSHGSALVVGTTPIRWVTLFFCIYFMWVLALFKCVSAIFFIVWLLFSCSEIEDTGVLVSNYQCATAFNPKNWSCLVDVPR